MNLLALFQRPRLTLTMITAVSLGLLGFALYLQHSVGLDPCPMCVTQRLVYTGIIFVAALGALIGRRWALLITSFLGSVLGLIGVGTAGRHSYLQMFPNPSYSCGRDLFDIVNTFEISDALKQIYRGTGECAKVDWTFLGLSIAQWSFIWLLAITVLMMVAFWRALKAERKIF